VHKTCSPIIGRNTRHTPCSSCKTAEFYRERDVSVKPARRKMARIPAKFAPGQIG
jgi:molybdopterin-biosynthesis enzyme MoeA-like protein